MGYGYKRDFGDVVFDHPIVSTVVGIVLLVIILGGPFVCIADAGGADGRHSIYVVAVEDQHNFTWDSTVVYVKTDAQASNEDTYCVVDPGVRHLLDEAARKRTRIVIRYRNDLVMWRWDCNGGSSIIVGVEGGDSP